MLQTEQLTLTSWNLWKEKYPYAIVTENNWGKMWSSFQFLWYVGHCNTLISPEGLNRQYRKITKTSVFPSDSIWKMLPCTYRWEHSQSGLPECHRNWDPGYWIGCSRPLGRVRLTAYLKKRKREWGSSFKLPHSCSLSIPSSIYITLPRGTIYSPGSGVGKPQRQ